MAFVTTNLGLSVWDQEADQFNHTELANNWSTIDEHDHSAGKGVQISTDGLANLAVTGPKLAADSVDSSKIAANAVGNSELADASVGTAELQDSSVIAAKLAGSIPDSKLASPNNAVWRPVFYDVVTINAAGNTAAGVYVWNNGSLVLNGVTADTRLMKLWRPVAADVAVPGLTAKIRIRATIASNSLSAGTSYTVKLYPITSIGSVSNVLNLQALDVPKIVGPTQVITGGFWSAISGSVDLGVVNDAYAFGVQTSAATPTNAVLSINAYLEMQHA